MASEDELRAAHAITAAATKHPARQAGGRRRISRASPTIRRQARRVRPGWAHRPRAPRMRPSVGPSVFLPHSSRPESAAGPRPVVRGYCSGLTACCGVGAAPGTSRPAGARNKALPTRLPTQPRSTPPGRLGSLRRNSRASPVIRRQARRVRPGRAHRPRAPRMRPSVGPSGCLPHRYRPESAAGPRPVVAGGAAPGASRPAGARNKATPSHLPSRLL